MKKSKSKEPAALGKAQEGGSKDLKLPGKIPHGSKKPGLPNRVPATLSGAVKSQQGQEEDRVTHILNLLQTLYPEARCALDHDTPLQLLVATILSAQCTDLRVNRVTPALFSRYPDATAFSLAKPSELETMIGSTGFFRNKAANIIACCQALVADHGGQVPKTMEELIPLAGVGRKTANVVLGNAFGIPGITVDTHVGRLSRRMGLTQEISPEKVELALMKQIPQPLWTLFSHRMIFHGRQVCEARKPRCGSCALQPVCPKVGVKKREEPA